ncbi:MAG: hypothetical protein ABIS14_02000 [Sphingomonas sp.]
MTVTLAALVLAAAAQTVPPGTYQMNSAEVQACGAMAVERKARDAELNQRDAAIDAERTALQAKQAEVEAQRAAVKTTDKKQVAKFNVLIESVNAATTAFQPKLAARNAYLAENNAFVDSYNAKCAHRSFSPADLAALPADQREALSGNLTTHTIMVPANTPKRKQR